MAGRGYRMSRGVGHRITMADGSSTVETGRGGRVRWASMEDGVITRFGRPPMCRSLGGAMASVWDSDSGTWDGCQLARLTRSARGGALALIG